MLVLLATVVVVHLGSMFIYQESARDAASEAHTAQIAGRLATAIKAVAERPAGERDATAHELSTDVVTLRWDTRPITDVPPDRDARLRGLARSLTDAAPDLRSTDFRLEYSSVETGWRRSCHCWSGAPCRPILVELQRSSHYRNQA